MKAYKIGNKQWNPKQIEGRFQEYLLEKESAKATIQKYQTDVRTFFYFLRETNQSQVLKKEQLVVYKQWLVEHYARNSVNSMLAGLNQFLECFQLKEWKVKLLKSQKQ
ncbi:MAG: site-specific integrase, partial [Clostridiales bacterium]|nr:site-specific integrase [Clostridiales bacterium]